MAYVVARPNNRFEIRESVHTPDGPRARSLGNFARLTEEVLTNASQRATRPFDAAAVRASAERAGAPMATRPISARAPSEEAGRKHFVASSRRMARSLGSGPPADRPDPGDALIDLLGFVAQISPFLPTRDPEPLRFPPLARLRDEQ
ncbi:MAG TPA: hypothetical protein VGG38_17220 [Acidimicrobiales bacterium]|jgi:hypothetical protein